MAKFIRLLIILLFFQVVPASAFECSGQTYSVGDFDEPLSQFTPYDKIYVMIRCRDLGAGEYTMYANWIHRNQGIVRTDSHKFTVEKKKDQQVFFWFKLARRGPLKSAFTNQDFYEKHFGDWVVNGYLNDDPVSSNEFTISY